MDMQIPKNHLPHEQFEETKTPKQSHPFSVQTAIQSVGKKPEIQISRSQISEVKNGKKEPPIQKHMQHILSDIHMASFVTDVSSGMPSACAHMHPSDFTTSIVQAAETAQEPFWTNIAGGKDSGEKLRQHAIKKEKFEVEKMLASRMDVIVKTMNENQELAQQFLRQRNDS